MSEQTPRTDAVLQATAVILGLSAEDLPQGWTALTRQLERELAAMTTQRDGWQADAHRYALNADHHESRERALREALQCFVSSKYSVSTAIDERGHSWCEAYLDQALPIAVAALAQEAKP